MTTIAAVVQLRHTNAARRIRSRCCSGVIAAQRAALSVRRIATALHCQFHAEAVRMVKAGGSMGKVSIRGRG